MPTSRREAQTALGFLNYYLRFIGKFSAKAAENREAIEKEPFARTTGCQNTTAQLLEEIRHAECQQLPSSFTPKIVEIGTLPESIEVCCPSKEGELIMRISAILEAS